MSERGSNLTLGLLALGVAGAAVLLAGRAFEHFGPTPVGRVIRDPGATSAPPPTFVPRLPPVPNLATAPRQTTLDDSLSQEASLLGEARAVLTSDPTRAALLLEQHRERFPEGALREEREAYALLAMVGRGRPDFEVERRFLDFVTTYPTSRFRETIEHTRASNRR